MKAIVNTEACIGCGLCAEICPDVFQMQGACAAVIANPVPEEAEASCMEASDECPASAISLEEEEGT